MERSCCCCFEEESWEDLDKTLCLNSSLRHNWRETLDCELVYYEVDLSITLSIASVFWQSWLHYGWASAFSCRNSMSDWPNFQLEKFATHSPWGCLPVFCANESWMHQKSKGKCLGSMDRLRGITVSWRSGSSNLSTWRVYLLLKILTRFDLFCFICICQKSPFFPALYKTHECSYVLKPRPCYCWRSSTWAGWALAAHGQLSVVHIKMLHWS